MARHSRLHHHHDHPILSQIGSSSLFDKEKPLQLKQILETPLAQVKSILKRTPPDVGGGSSDSDSSDSDSSSSSSDSSSSDDSSDSTDSSDSSSSTSASSSSSSSSSGSGSSKSSSHGGTNISVPVALGVIIPILLAVVLFFFLHRRHVRRLRQEDANDPHKSLDFGWEPMQNGANKKRGKSKKGKPSISVREIGLEKGGRRDRGVSMDLDVGSPYLLPPGLQGSRESLHSMSRTIHSQDDRYRPVTTNLSDGHSLRSNKTKRGFDDTSSRAGSSSVHRAGRDDMKQDLLSGAQRMSNSMPPVDHSPIPQIQVPEPAQEVTRKPLPANPVLPSNSNLSPAPALNDARDSYQPSEDLRKSNNYLGAFIHSRDPSLLTKSPESEKSEYLTPREAPSSPTPAMQPPEHSQSPPPSAASPALPRSPRQQSLRSSQHASIEHTLSDDGSRYGDAVKVTPASPRMSQQEFYSNNNRGSSQEYMPPIDEYSLGVNESDFGYDVRRLSMGVRPLPPEEPGDNPEQRANRIRSFYKEYFDDSKGHAGAGDYYEDYDETYLGDGAIWDPSSGQFVTSQPRMYAEPYGRRAMTPPPRRRHAATMSGATHLRPPGHRAFSSVSAPGQRRPPPKKLPPPKALRVLPTPHMIQEDAFASPIDFAPASGAKERRAGMPESPRGGMRPFSPAVRPHTPLARSYDDLAVMPSPHLLRKSGVFTALDFAPPPRFKNSDTGSDAGSIRSNRSGVSARTQHAVRAGAYRVSRIPKEVVGTKGDLMDSLKPQWNMHNNTGTIGMPVK